MSHDPTGPVGDEPSDSPPDTLPPSAETAEHPVPWDDIPTVNMGGDELAAEAWKQYATILEAEYAPQLVPGMARPFRVRLSSSV